jgi:hypothetical protein
MKDFKDSTRTKYACGGSVKGPRGAAAVSQSVAALKGTVKKQDGGAIGRANRVQALEAQEEAKLLREVPARPTRGNRPDYTTERPARTPRRRGPAGAGFATRPLVTPRP